MHLLYRLNLLDQKAGFNPESFVPLFHGIFICSKHINDLVILNEYKLAFTLIR